jgi:hypothetical protein
VGDQLADTVLEVEDDETGAETKRFDSVGIIKMIRAEG